MPTVNVVMNRLHPDFGRPMHNPACTVHCTFPDTQAAPSVPSHSFDADKPPAVSQLNKSGQVATSGRPHAAEPSRASSGENIE